MTVIGRRSAETWEDLGGEGLGVEAGASQRRPSGKGGDGGQ